MREVNKIYINYKINIDNSKDKIYNTNVEIFTYRDYIKYQQIYGNKYSILKEDEEEYLLKNEISKKIINNEHDKIFRKILDIKSEAVDFINNSLNLKNKIAEEQIEKYTSSFITDDLKNEESDVIYKLKDKNIFFLIEHQTKVDYKMPVRILEYEIAIIKSAIDYKKFGQKDYKIPKVISIVLYTGKRKWNAKNYINEIQKRFEEFEESEFSKYNVIDINNIPEEKLLKEYNYLSKIMLLEKYKGNDLSEYLNKIAQEIKANEKYYNTQGKEILIILIEQILLTKIGERKTKEILKILKGGNEDMLNCIESAYRENRAYFNNGVKAGMKNGMEKGLLKAKTDIVKELLKIKMPISQISQITHLTEKKIKEIEQEDVS